MSIRRSTTNRRLGRAAATGEFAWSVVWFKQSIQDAAYALRIIRRNPGFGLAVILTLALGIGMNTAMFSVLDAVLLHRVPYPNADRLLWAASYDTAYESEVDRRLLLSDYSAFRQEARSFDSTAAYSNQDLALVYRGDSAAERIASITGDLWSMAGAKPALGRFFNSGEPSAIVLSWQLFERRFAGDPGVIGRTVAVSGHPFEIVGVLPATFRFLFPQFLYPDDERRDIDAYIAIPNAALNLPMSAYKMDAWDKILEELGPTPDFVGVVAKLRTDAPSRVGQAELEAIYQRVMEEKPGVYHTHSRLRVQTLQEKLTGNLRPALLTLSGAVGFVLLIVCANVANLLLSRASARQREMAIREALGAGRLRLLRQFLVESLLFALAGAAIGLAIARWAIAIIVRLGAGAVPNLAETGIDAAVLVFTVAISLAAGLLFGLTPATSMMRTRAATSSAGQVRVRSGLVALEIAMAVVLLSGAGLMLRSFWQMNAFPPGFAPDKTVVSRISLSGPSYNGWPQQRNYIDELFRRLRTVPGVQEVGVHCSNFNTSIGVEGMAPENQPLAAIRYVSPGYLRAMGIALLEGHWPGENEELGAVIVNQSFARRVGTGDVIGKRIHASLLSATIAGVVPDFKASQLDAEPGPEVYAAYQMSPRVSLVTVLVRVAGDAARTIPQIRQTTSGIDRNVPTYRVETLERELQSSIAPRRFNLLLLGWFAGVALLLASIGIYGTIAYSVAQRTQEIGIRMALGAQRREVIGMVIRQGMAVTLTGVALGLVAAVGLTRLMASLLYRVTPNDPVTFVAVAGVVSAIALCACCGPAVKAGLVDPIIALRYE